MTPSELYNKLPTTGDEGSLGVAEHIEPEIKQHGIVEDSTVNKVFEFRERVATHEDYEIMVGQLTKRRMMLGKIIARFEGDVIIKDKDNIIDVTFSKDISPENKAEIQNLIFKLFEEINESPIIVKQDGLT